MDFVKKLNELKKRKRIIRFFNVCFVILIVAEMVCLSCTAYDTDLWYAERYQEQGEYAKAIAMYLNLIERNETEELYIKCADCYLAAGDKDSAYTILKDTGYNSVDIKLNSIQWDELSQEITVEPDNNYTSFDTDGTYDIFLLLILFTVIAVALLNIVFHFQIKKYKQQIDYEIFFSKPVPDNRFGKADCSRFSFKDNEEKPSVTYDTHLIAPKVKNSAADNEEKTTATDDMSLSAPKVENSILSSVKKALTDDEEKQANKYVVDNRPADEWFIASCNRYAEKKANEELEEERKEQERLKNYPPLKIIDFKQKRTEEQKVNEPKPPMTVNEVLNIVDGMSTDGWKFEKFCAELLLRNGFAKAEVTSGSNDYGVDIIAEDEKGIKFAIQCKCYSEKLGNSSIQEVFGGRQKYNCQVCVVLTNNYFTNNAIELARVDNVLLWDRDKLTKFIKNAMADITDILQ